MDLTPDSISVLTTLKDKTVGKHQIVFVSGNFNIVHPGHLRLLRFAAECGDFLVVGVYADDLKRGALVPEELRKENVEAISWVNWAFILHDPPEHLISQLKPQIVVKGKEYEHHFNPEEVVKQYGGKLLFGSGDIIFSSVDLLRREFHELNQATIIKDYDFLQRHHFTLPDLATTVAAFKNLRVCILGEIIVDEYITCDPLGMSQEDPTIVITPLWAEKFVGGAGIVSTHAAGLGANVTLFSVVGKDDTARFARQQLDLNRVRAYLYEDDSRPTILKQRFRTQGKTLLRVNHLRSHAIDQEIQAKFFRDFQVMVDQVDLVIFSDFNYGCLPQPLVDNIVTECQQRQVMTVADSQCSSQVGDVSRFKGMTLLTPTEREARISVRDFESGLVVLAESLRCQAQSRHLLLTLASEGVLIHGYVSETHQSLTDRLPAFNTAPKDVAGAGDTLLICAAMSLALGNDIWQSAYWGSLAAACQVGRVGNIPLISEDLYRELSQ